MERLNPSFLWFFGILTGFAMYGGVAVAARTYNFKYRRHPAADTEQAKGPDKPHQSGAPTPQVAGLGSSDKIDYAAAMTDEAVDARLNELAYSHTVGGVSGVAGYDGAQLGSNEICEDAYLHGKFANPLKGGGDGDWMAWGVFDGHNGPHTAHVLKRQLLPYVQRALGDIEPKEGIIADLDIQMAIKTAFMELDEHLVDRAQEIIDSNLPYSEKVKQLEPAHSDACAMLTLYNPSSRKIYTAYVGDCRAVWGFEGEGKRWDKWKADAYSESHTGANRTEIARLQSEFPGEPNIFRHRGRVYGKQPSRVFGAGVYKWNEKLRERLRAEYSAHKHPNGSTFPGFKDGPYLKAEPTVHVRLLPEDGTRCFLIQATDGLWDTMGNQDAASLVGNWRELKQRGSQLKIVSSNEPVKLGRLGCWFSEPRATFRDSNAAVHLIRNGIGGSNDDMVRSALSFEPPLSRNVRDDITVQVIFFGDWLPKMVVSKRL